MDLIVRRAVPADGKTIETMLPRLAEFDIPPHRVSKHLWEGDQVLVRDWAEGNRGDVLVSVAEIEQSIVGAVVVSARKELLSGEPSAHLEIIVIKKGYEGRGIGSALMDESEGLAAEFGAKSMSLHVFANNKTARQLYEKKGFDGELLRYYKPLE